MRINWYYKEYLPHGLLYSERGKKAKKERVIYVELRDFHQNKKDEYEVTEFWPLAKFYYIYNWKTTQHRNWACKNYGEKQNERNDN